MGSKPEIKDVSHITKFQGSNFQLWKFQMQLVLDAKDIMGVVEGSEAKPHQNANSLKEWEKKDKAGKMYICAALSEKIVEHLLNCKTSSQMWKRLSVLHEQNAAENKHLLQ
jgi:hypothetical protein